MPNFTVELLKPCRIGDAVHQAFSIHSDDVHVGNGLNVHMDDGRRFIRIFDYDKPIEAELGSYFASRKDVDEVSFSRPYQP